MKKRKKIRWKDILPYYLLALPGIIYMICNNYLPMFGIVIAFKNLNFLLSRRHIIENVLEAEQPLLDNCIARKFSLGSSNARCTMKENFILQTISGLTYSYKVAQMD